MMVTVMMMLTSIITVVDGNSDDVHGDNDGNSDNDNGDIDNYSC